MKFENPEYIGLMFLHGARYHLEKALAARYSEKAMRRLRPILPYQIVIDGDDHPGVVNRDYKPLGITTIAWVDYDGYPQFRVPKTKVKIAVDEPGREEGGVWLFNDGCPPWFKRASAEAYLATLDRLFDFTVEGV